MIFMTYTNFLSCSVQTIDRPLRMAYAIYDALPTKVLIENVRGRVNRIIFV